VGLQQLAEVHAVELIAGEDQDVGRPVLDDVADLLADGVGGPLVPVGGLVGLLGGEDLDEAAAEGVKLVGVGDVAVQADAEELCQDVDAIQTAVDAIADRDVDEAVLAGDGDSRLGAQLRQRVQTGAASAAEDEAEYVVHNGLGEYSGLTSRGRGPGIGPLAHVTIRFGNATP